MKLSEAIMLGSATCKLVPGNINSCAYGAALNAMGVPPVSDPRDWPLSLGRWKAAVYLWPWLCNGPWFSGPSLTSEAILIYIRFDGSVCRGEMTLEELVDYVRSVEPECGSCCEFVCRCESALNTHNSKQEQTLESASFLATAGKGV